MSVKFTYYGGMCVLIERSDGYKILCDPYFTKNVQTEAVPEDFQDVNLILVTHHASDHYGNVEEVMACSKAQVMMCSDNIHLIKQHMDLPKERLVSTVYGDCRQFGQTVVRTMLAFHTSKHTNGGILTYGPPVGYLIEVESGVTYYHTGDTALSENFRTIRELYHPNIMCAGISGIRPGASREMTEREAALGVSWCGVDVVIPTHYVTGTDSLNVFKQHLASFAPYVKVMDEIEQPFCLEPLRVYSI